MVAEFLQSRRCKAEALVASATTTSLSTETQGTAAVQEAALALLVERDLSKWAADDAMELVKTFVQIRFPFVLVLNKCDAVRTHS